MSPSPLILVVDDELPFQRFLRRCLTSAGYRPVFSRSSTRVPRHVCRLRPDAVVLDAALGPGLSGFQVCAILKQSPETRQVPVLMISARYPDNEAEREAKRCGADGYIPKRQLWPELGSRLSALLKSHPTHGKSSESDGPVHDGSVLVLDGAGRTLAQARRRLREAGHRIVAARDQAEIVALAAKHRPDCIVLDHQICRPAVPEICHFLQTRAETRAIPVVILTGHRNCRKECLDCGADHCVGADEPPEEFMRSVSVAIRRFRWSVGVLVRGDVRLDRRDGAVMLNGRLVAHLADNRFELFHALVQASPQCVSPEELCVRLSMEPREGSTALDKLVARTKKDLGKPLSDRIHQLKDIGWTYEFALPAANAD